VNLTVKIIILLIAIGVLYFLSAAIIGLAKFILALAVIGAAGFGLYYAAKRYNLL
jgi:hypothetical protein